MTDMNFPAPPSPIRVGYRTYRIEYLDPWEARNEGLFGSHNHQTSVIRLDPAMDPEKAANTLIHEILHAVWTVWCLTYHDEVKEENAVVATANGLTTVFRDNPELMTWCANCLHRDKDHGSP